MVCKNGPYTFKTSAYMFVPPKNKEKEKNASWKSKNSSTNVHV